jgi:cell division septum initiation protein DivIVA
VATPPSATPSGSHPDAQPFDTVLRGYERRQVDDFVSRTKDEIAQLKENLAEAQRKRRLATDHAEATERELRDLRTKSAHTEPRAVEDSFGYRAEKLLRIAEQEAAEVRTHASRESAAIIEQARTEAEKHRHEVEQTLISRASLLEQQASQRNAELQEREQQIADQLVAAREQADQLHAAAARTADRLRQESEAAAEEAKLRAASDIQRQRDQASQEINRLDKVQGDVRSELARLNEVLSEELAGSRPGSGQRNGNRWRNGESTEGEQQATPASNGGNGGNNGNAHGRRGKPEREETVAGAR